MYTVRYYVLLPLLALALVLSGCNNLVSPHTSKQAAGNVIIQAEAGEAGARTLHPDLSQFTSIVSFQGPEAVEQVIVEPGTPISVTLAQGNWTVTATTYAVATPIARGSWTGTVGSETVTISITLKPITGGDNGTFAYSIGGLAAADTAALTVTPVTESGAGTPDTIDLLAGASAGSLSLAPGFYLLAVQLTDASGKYAGKTEAVHIYPTMTTRADYSFSAYDFRVVVPLTDKVWVTGVTAAGASDYYKFHAEAGKRYVITWQNSYYYNSSYHTSAAGNALTGVNYVSAAWANGTSLFNNTYNGYSNTYSVLAASADDVIITSVPYSSNYYGSYKIAFAEVEPFNETSWSQKTLPAGGFAYYEASLPASVSRTIQWKDKDNGLDSDAADIRVSAFWGSQTSTSFSSIFNNIDSGYDIPQPFMYYTQYVVLIRAEAKTAEDAGAYALRYAEPAALTLDQQVSGTLAAGNSATWRFTADQSKLYQISWTGNVRVSALTPGSTYNAGTTSEYFYSASPVFTAAETGPMNAAANGPLFIQMNAAEGGAYTMTISEVVITPTALTTGQWTPGELASGDTAYYQFTAQANKRYVITLKDRSSYGNGLSDGLRSIITSTEKNVIIRMELYTNNGSYPGTYALGVFEAEPLTGGNWTDKTHTAGSTSFYTFQADQRLPYPIQWKDKGEGGEAGGADIRVSAFYESSGYGTPYILRNAFTNTDSGFNNPPVLVPSNTSYTGPVIVRVIGKTQTEVGAYSLRYSAMNNPTALSQDSSATASLAAGDIQAYSFSADANQAYQIQWEDAVDQSGSTYTGDIVVSAYRIRQSGSSTYIEQLFSRLDSAYTAPQLTSYSTAYTVLLLVQPKPAASAGSYALVYGEAVLPVVDLTSGTYTGGTLTGIGELYRFNATSSTAYSVSIQRAGDQAPGSSYTAQDINVTVYWENDNTVIVQRTNLYSNVNNWYTTPQVFNTGGRSGNVIIKVEPWSAGYVGQTYGVLFTTP